jgi:hypothetical protein
MKKDKISVVTILFFLLVVTISVSFAGVIQKNGKVFLRDRRGESWDISQAVSIGFDPYSFEFGLGKNAFKPLDDSHLRNASNTVPQRLRIIGVTGESGSKAFSVKKLGGHEIANSFVDDAPIAAAY